MVRVCSSSTYGTHMVKGAVILGRQDENLVYAVYWTYGEPDMAAIIEALSGMDFFSGLLIAALGLLAGMQVERMRNDRQALRVLHRNLVTVMHANNFLNLYSGNEETLLIDRCETYRRARKEARHIIADTAWDVRGKAHAILVGGAVLASQDNESNVWGEPDEALKIIIKKMALILNPKVREQVEIQQGRD